MESNVLIFLFLVLALVALTTLLIILFFRFKAEKQQRLDLSDQNKKLSETNTLLEGHNLKFQLQPHTLNNILANLKALSGKLSRGMDSLSEILDYILYQGQNNLVSVKEEIAFIEKYLKLNDLFTSEIDSVYFDTNGVNPASEYYEKTCVPHLITAHFIENAYKHGDINHPEFMRIRLTLTDNLFMLNVVNRIKYKETNGGNGIGLTNMKKRLELSNPGNYEIRCSCNEQEYHASLEIRLQP
jgi:LytS/YehU family sensor histidine kinase